MRFFRRTDPDRPPPVEGDSDAAPATTTSTMVDPPYAYREPVRRDRLNHVTNDVYVRNRTGKRWHRVYRVAYTFVGNPNPRLGGYGRSLMLVCGGAAYDWEPDEEWTFEPTPVRTDVPGPDEICKACRRSDARYGKGDIPNTRRWDR